jgi:hypothetical protein
VRPVQLFETPHRSLQPPLWTWGGDVWLPVLRLPAYAPRRSPGAAVLQLPLFALRQAEA